VTNLFQIVWGVFVVAWLVFVLLTGEFKVGRHHGTPITPTEHPVFFWFVVIAWAALGCTFIATGIRGARRELLDLETPGRKKDEAKA
jgi:hypothetical protein